MPLVQLALTSLHTSSKRPTFAGNTLPRPLRNGYVVTRDETPSLRDCTHVGCYQAAVAELRPPYGRSWYGCPTHHPAMSIALGIGLPLSDHVTTIWLDNRTAAERAADRASFIEQASRTAAAARRKGIDT